MSNLESIRRQKEQYRQEARQIRRRLDMGIISRQIVEHIAHWGEFQRARLVLVYRALPGEVDLAPLVLQYPSKAWYLPRVLSSREMCFHRFYPGDTLEKSRFGVLEPLASAEPLSPDSDIDLVFVPGLMLDQQGVRLGFGKGYYDRFLARLPFRPVLACPIPHCLVTPRLPAEPWDICVSWGITEKEVQHFPCIGG